MGRGREVRGVGGGAGAGEGAGAQGTCDHRSAAVTRTEVSGDGKRLGVLPSSSSAPAGAECGVAGVGSAVTGMLGSSEGGTVGGTVGGAVAGAALLGPAPPPPPFAAGTWTAALACLPSG